MTMDAKHIADETLIDYADDPASVSDRAAVDEHLASCAACWTKLDDFRLLGNAMRDEETWWAVDKVVSGEGGRALREAIERRAAEDAEAERVLRPLLETEYRFSYSNIARRKRFQTGGVVRLLCSEARDKRSEIRVAVCIIGFYPNAQVKFLKAL